MAEDDNDNNFDENEEHEIFYEKLKRKLTDEVVVKKIYNAKRDIEHELGCQIILSIANVEDEYAEDLFNSLNNIGIDKKTNSMKLGYLIDYLSTEDKNLNVYIDPLHLKAGLNPLTNLVFVAMDDHIILVPKNEI
jgi:hypothetical protein